MTRLETGEALTRLERSQDSDAQLEGDKEGKEEEVSDQ